MITIDKPSGIYNGYNNLQMHFQSDSTKQSLKADITIKPTFPQGLSDEQFQTVPIGNEFYFNPIEIVKKLFHEFTDDFTYENSVLSDNLKLTLDFEICITFDDDSSETETFSNYTFLKSVGQINSPVQLDDNRLLKISNDKCIYADYPFSVTTLNGGNVYRIPLSDGNTINLNPQVVLQWQYRRNEGNWINFGTGKLNENFTIPQGDGGATYEFRTIAYEL